DRHLEASGPFLLGERFSAADIFAYMLSTWQQSCPDAYQRFPSLKRLVDKVAARPAMERVIRKNAG
ncbi:MAG TPA: glutathione S-transferase family protein, partial [Dongiaceae bacterium]